MVGVGDGINNSTPEKSVNEISIACVGGPFFHYSKKHPCITTAYVVRMKETYEDITNLVEKINYNKHCWNVCGDLKTVAILLGM
jgi:hypothetical protein